MTHATCVLMWMHNLLQELGFSLEEPMTMFSDNLVAIHIAYL